MKFIIFFILTLSACSTLTRSNTKVAGLANYLNLPPKAHGSAFRMVFNNTDYIITAEHVCGNLTTMLINGYITNVIYTNKQYDLCVLDATNVFGLKTLKPSKQPILSGQKIQVVGYPRGHIYQNVISEGRIIGKDYWSILYMDGFRKIAVYTVTAPSFPGNSGGPVIRDGRVIGVLVASETPTSFGAIIPINDILKTMKKDGL